MKRYDAEINEAHPHGNVVLHSDALSALADLRERAAKELRGVICDDCLHATCRELKNTVERIRALPLIEDEQKEKTE